jgi:hypothetical protein
VSEEITRRGYTWPIFDLIFVPEGYSVLLGMRSHLECCSKLQYLSSQLMFRMNGIQDLFHSLFIIKPGATWKKPSLTRWKLSPYKYLFVQTVRGSYTFTCVVDNQQFYMDDEINGNTFNVRQNIFVRRIVLWWCLLYSCI